MKVCDLRFNALANHPTLQKKVKENEKERKENKKYKKGK